MNMITEINIKVAEDEIYQNTLTVMSDIPEYYCVDGRSHIKYGLLIYRLQELFETTTPLKILEQIKRNNCTTRISGIDFHL